MLKASREFVAHQIDQGLTLEEIQAKGLPEKWNPWTKGFLNEESWLKILFASLISSPCTVKS